jgi:hypothetical protein
LQHSQDKEPGNQPLAKFQWVCLNNQSKTHQHVPASKANSLLDNTLEAEKANFVQLCR